MLSLRIVAIRLSSMGDVIHALPAVASLKHSFPHSRVTWLVRPRWMPLLEGNPYIDEAIPVERSIPASWAVARRLRAERCDLAIDFQGLIQTALLAAAFRPERIVGFDRNQVRERLAALVYSSEVATPALHAVDRNLDLAAGAGATNILRTFPLPPGQPEGTLPAGKFILASPLAGWGGKQWPLEYWADLAARLELPLVVNGPPDSASALQQIRGAHVHLSGIAGLLDATRRAHAVIGVDSGPMHLAAALSKPGVAIFGPTNPARHGPYGGSLRVLRSPDAQDDYKRHADPAASMHAITPPMVAATLTSVLEGCLA
jgi:lipopolysaccharide heptosyltransferase I